MIRKHALSLLSKSCRVAKIKKSSGSPTSACTRPKTTGGTWWQVPDHPAGEQFLRETVVANLNRGVQCQIRKKNNSCLACNPYRARLSHCQYIAVLFIKRVRRWHHKWRVLLEVVAADSGHNEKWRLLRTKTPALL